MNDLVYTNRMSHEQYKVWQHWQVVAAVIASEGLLRKSENYIWLCLIKFGLVNGISRPDLDLALGLGYRRKTETDKALARTRHSP